MLVGGTGLPPAAVTRARCVEESTSSVVICLEVQNARNVVEPQFLPQLFSAFEQADNSMMRQLGLGLVVEADFNGFALMVDAPSSRPPQNAERLSRFTM